jgi:hypothetical protein
MIDGTIISILTEALRGGSPPHETGAYDVIRYEDAQGRDRRFGVKSSGVAL